MNAVKNISINDNHMETNHEVLCLQRQYSTNDYLRDINRQSTIS
jgi:hypothetical protein